MSEHVLIEGGKRTDAPGWLFLLSVWCDGAYLTVDDAPTYDDAILKADEIAADWDGIPVVDRVL